MTLVLSILLGIPLLVPAPIVDAEDQATKKELEKLQGNWQAVKKNGELDDSWLSIQKSKVTILKDNDKKEISSIDLKLAAAKKPKELDLPGESGKPILAIYELDGDTLKLCIFAGEKNSKERPKELAAKEGQVILRLVRDKQ